MIFTSVIDYYSCHSHVLLTNVLTSAPPAGVELKVQPKAVVHFSGCVWSCHRKCCRRCGSIPTPGSQWASEPFQQHIFQTPLWYQTKVVVQHTLQLLLSSNKWNLRFFFFIAFSTCVYAPPWRDLESNMILMPDMSWGSCRCFIPLKLQYLSRLSAVREIKKCNYPFCCYSAVK